MKVDRLYLVCVGCRALDLEQLGVPPSAVEADNWRIAFVDLERFPLDLNQGKTPQGRSAFVGTEERPLLLVWS
jgi:hypothetical protein